MIIKPIKTGKYEKVIDKTRYLYNFIEGVSVEVLDILVSDIEKKGFIGSKKKKLTIKKEEK